MSDIRTTWNVTRGDWTVSGSQLLDGKVTFTPDNARPDRTIAVLQACVTRMVVLGRAAQGNIPK